VAHWLDDLALRLVRDGQTQTPDRAAHPAPSTQQPASMTTASDADRVTRRNTLKLIFGVAVAAGPVYPLVALAQSTGGTQQPCYAQCVKKANDEYNLVVRDSCQGRDSAEPPTPGGALAQILCTWWFGRQRTQRITKCGKPNCGLPMQTTTTPPPTATFTTCTPPYILCNGICIDGTIFICCGSQAGGYCSVGEICCPNKCSSPALGC
jgi:hypothetical protein